MDKEKDKPKIPEPGTTQTFEIPCLNIEIKMNEGKEEA